MLEDAKSWNTQESDGIPYVTHLQIGALYFVTTNIDVADGLFNGALGFLRRIDYRDNASHLRIPYTAWIQFENPQIGLAQRDKTRARILKDNIPTDWVPIDRISRSLSRSHLYAGAELVRTQIPLVGANGMTIAKSQGSSMPIVVVSMKRKLSREQLYVACSRATTSQGLYIDGEFVAPAYPGDDDDVTKEMEILRNVPVKLLGQVPLNCKVYFHNVENFVKHRADLLADRNAMSADVIALIEPHVRSQDCVDINGYICDSRKYSGGTLNWRNSEGHLIYRKAGTKYMLIICFI